MIPCVLHSFLTCSVGERLHDGPRHAADVGAPVATDLRLIPHASRDNHVFNDLKTIWFNSDIFCKDLLYHLYDLMNQNTLTHSDLFKLDLSIQNYIYTDYTVYKW